MGIQKRSLSLLNPPRSRSEKREYLKAALLLGFFFFTIAAFWTLKPLRTSGVIKTFSIDYYPVIRQGVLLLVPLILMLYSVAAVRLSRRKLVYALTAIFVLMNIAFWIMFTRYPADWVRVVFFFYVDAYVTVMVTLFWTYTNDVYGVLDARRAYGFIGAGGILGGIFGSSISGWASQALQNGIVLVAAVLLLPIPAIVHVLESFFPEDPLLSKNRLSMGKRRIQTEETVGQSFTAGWRAVANSKYLICIALIVGVYEVISASIDFQFNSSSSEAFPKMLDMAAFQGKVFFWAQVAALALQIFLVPLIHARLGAVAGLLFLPTALFFGSAAFALIPALASITFLIGSEAAMQYSVNQSSKEILYVPLDAGAKYRGKAFIDMFVVRSSKTLGALFLIFYTFYLSKVGIGPRWLIGMNTLLIAIWLIAIVSAGRHYSVLTANREPGKKG